MSPNYQEVFQVGTKVRIVSKSKLEDFARTWKYHHKLQPEQMEYAGTQSTVKSVGFYHGGDSLYVLEGIPGIWHEACLETAQ